MDVFIFGIKSKLAFFDFFADEFQTFFNFFDVFGFQNAGLAQHRDMSETALNVIRA